MSQPTSSNAAAPAPFWARLLLRLGLFSLLWLGVTGAAPGGLLIGALAVALATALSVALWPRSPWGLRPAGLPGFAAYFLSRSLGGALDVARRAFSPSCPLDPGFLRYTSRIADKTPRIFFCHCISLLPGTCVVRLRGQELEVHVLDLGADARAELQRLERQVAALFGAELLPAPPADGVTP